MYHIQVIIKFIDGDIYYIWKTRTGEVGGRYIMYFGNYNVDMLMNNSEHNGGHAYMLTYNPSVFMQMQPL